MPRNDCPVCKKTANAVPSNKSGSVQCSVCDLWFHPACADMTTEVYEYIKKGKEHGLPNVWSCHVCTTAWTKIEKRVKEVAKIAMENDRRITALEKSKTSDDEKMKKMEDRLKKLEEKVEKVETDGSTDNSEKVLEEISARSSKDRNLVLQNCAESETENAINSSSADLVGVQGLFDRLDVRLEAKHALIGTRRLGEKLGKENPRPLLLIFKRKPDRDLLLERAPRLARETDDYWKQIRILADLTKKQRDMEALLFKKSEESNLKRSDDDVAKNLVWKVVGRRGERVLRQYEMQDDEEINEDGRVVHKRGEVQEDHSRKRQRSPQSGHSPLPRRPRVGVPGRFGQTE